MPAVFADDLRKVFHSVRKQPGIAGGLKSLVRPDRVEIEAVRGISLSVEQGELVGFLGPNGAGKTTTLKMLSGILAPTSGIAEVLGHRPFDRRPEMLRRISLVMGNKMQLWWDLPAWDSFLVLKELYEVPEERFRQRIDALIDLLDLKDKVNTQVRKLSLGERMKCELAAALLHTPEVIFLDEPTIGLDVVSQKRIRDFLRERHREDGGTILLTSHYMQDVEELCHRVIVIDKGTLVFDGPISELHRRFADVRRIRLIFSSPVEAEDLAKYGRMVEADGASATIEVAHRETTQVASALLRNLPVQDVAIESADMEDIIRSLFTSSADVPRGTPEPQVN